MADKTTKIFVRTTGDFPRGQERRRAGLVIGGGPEPKEIEVTQEQLEAIQADSFLEVMDSKAVKKYHAGQLQSPRFSSDELESGEPDQTDGAGDEDEDESQDGPVEVNTDMKVKQLLQVATDEQVEDVEALSKPGVKKQAIVDAILAKRSEQDSEE